MVHLKEIDEDNLDECLNLKRKSNSFVGNSYDVLATTYVHRDIATAYGIYNDDTMVGMIVLLDRPKHNNYSFTEMFIADNFQGYGYATEAIKCTVKKFITEGKYSEIVLVVHNTNIIAINIYEKVGFKITRKASWDENFLVMKLEII